ncbi:MAG: DUF1565 domain-containing protein [Candidatus Eisenbacteria sp.]|nr:DUF1565 domain-containing protein [Candidatus Eisenbacteria bacterium]
MRWIMTNRILAVGLAVLVFGSWVGFAEGTTLKVPEDFQRIQDAMREARRGDTIIVGPGRYEGPVDIKNGVVLRSADGPEVTTIVGYRWWVVRLADADTVTAVIGFTLAGGRAADRVVYCSGGGAPRVLDNVVERGWFGIDCEGSSPTIRNNLVRLNKQGIHCLRCSPLVVRNHVTDNTKGIVIKDGSPRLRNNTIDLNKIGIVVEDYAVPTIGGSIEGANDIFDNHGYNLQNLVKVKEEGIRTSSPGLLSCEYNYWGSDCPDRAKFMGALDFKPWVDKEHSRKILSCPKE